MSEYIVSTVIALLSGSLAAATISAISSFLQTRRENRIAYIRRQLNELYGPLQFLATANKQLHRVREDLLGAANNVYDKEWSNKLSNVRSDVARRMTDDLDRVPVVWRLYTEHIAKNNQRIFELLEKHYSLIDPDDATVFAQFVVNHIRSTMETDEAGRSIVPFEVSRQLSNTSDIDLELIRVISGSYEQQRAELFKLLRLKQLPQQRGRVRQAE